MCCLGSFCLADLTVDEKSVTAVAVRGTKIACGVLYSTHTHFSSLCFVSRGILFSHFKAERQEKMPIGSQKQRSEKLYFNNHLYGFVSNLGFRLSFLHHLNEVHLSL